MLNDSNDVRAPVSTKHMLSDTDHSLPEMPERPVPSTSFKSQSSKKARITSTPSLRTSSKIQNKTLTSNMKNTIKYSMTTSMISTPLSKRTMNCTRGSRKRARSSSDSTYENSPPVRIGKTGKKIRRSCKPAESSMSSLESTMAHKHRR